MPSSRTRRWLPSRWGVLCSTIVHGTVIALAVAQWFWGFLPHPSAQASGPRIVLVAAPLVRPEPKQPQFDFAALNLAPSEDGQPAIDTDEILAGMDNPAAQGWDDPVPDATVDHAGSFVSVQLMHVIQEAERRSSEENFEKLKQLSERLTSISSDEAVGDINSQLRRVVGAEDRAERPAEQPIAGEFDFGTAQLHDVLRVKDEQGNFVYTAVLVDSAGRKFESPLAVSEGETTYRTMQLIKSNPLLEKVYRGVVMSMLDKVLKAAQ
jgi:hypothetical protein